MTEKLTINSDEQELINYVNETFDVEKLTDIIINFSVVAWDNKMQRPHLKRWLSNFDGQVLGNPDVEKILALWILMHYTYYSEKEVRALCKCVYEDYIHIKLLEAGSDVNIDDEIKSIIQNTRFQPLGNPSESGTNILYYFRQENNLPKICFEIDRTKTYNNIVYFDDMTISGSQAEKYITQKYTKGNKKYFMTLIATSDAITHLRDECDEITLIHPILLDERDKCFSCSGFVFSGEKVAKLKELAKKMCANYGEKLYKENSLGYKNGGYLFGFYYNTPDNTMPIIWSSEKNWINAFPRYDKKYTTGIDIKESKYV